MLRDLEENVSSSDEECGDAPGGKLADKPRSKGADEQKAIKAGDQRAYDEER